MPVSVKEILVRLTQRKFAAIAYERVNEAFAAHKELGSLELRMHATRIKSLQRINVAQKKVTFKTLHFSVPHFSVKFSSSLLCYFSISYS